MTAPHEFPKAFNVVRYGLLVLAVAGFAIALFG
jgi:hypothetical protein